MTKSSVRAALRRSALGLVVAGGLTVSAGASAQTIDARMAGDFNGVQEVAAGDLAGAERVLVSSLRISPVDPDLLLNLAALYRHQGRNTEAAALYTRVLARPDAVLALPGNRSASSHMLAQRALDRITPVTLTAR